MDVTLEATFKAFIDGYYRDLHPRYKKISFTNVDDILNLVTHTINNQRDGYLTQEMLNKLDFIAYGTYSFAPNCQGDILVTLHLIGKTGETKSYQGDGEPAVVMSQIASQIFTDFQRTQFPSTVKIGDKLLTLVGGLNGSVDTAASTQIAVRSCAAKGARLPTQFELEILDGMGDWSGGISLNHAIWVLSDKNIYAPDLNLPSPVREVWEVNETTFLYYCVK